MKNTSDVTAAKSPPAKTLPAKTKVVGIVGGICSGKSAVTRAFLSFGAVAFDADRAGHDSLSNPAVMTAARERWGNAVFGPDGQIDRKRLGAVVFAGPADLEYLDGLVHPLILEAFREALSRARQEGVALYVVDAPLLLETGMGEYCDYIVFVDTCDEIRAQRAKTRGWSGDELAKREKYQIFIEEKRKTADFIIDNNSTYAKIRGEVLSVVERIRERN